MKFRYAILYVSDVRETVAFYQVAFGLECAFIHECGDYAELATGETKLAIASREMIGRLGKSPAAPVAEAPTFELAFEVEDVAAAYDQAVKAGAAPVQAPRNEDWGQVTSYVRDRDGFLIELCSVVRQAG
jgi:uncharacterized glyoxalase superfamily protein PhnB